MAKALEILECDHCGTLLGLDYADLLQRRCDHCGKGYLSAPEADQDAFDEPRPDQESFLSDVELAESTWGRCSADLVILDASPVDISCSVCRWEGKQSDLSTNFRGDLCCPQCCSSQLFEGWQVFSVCDIVEISGLIRA